MKSAGLVKNIMLIIPNYTRFGTITMLGSEIYSVRNYTRFGTILGSELYPVRNYNSVTNYMFGSELPNYTLIFYFFFSNKNDHDLNMNMILLKIYLKS